MKLLRIVLFIFIAISALGLSPSDEVGQIDLSNKHGSSIGTKKEEFKVLIVNCQSTLYSELSRITTNFFIKEKVPHVICKREHDNLQDIIISKFKGFDLLIISGSSNFLPESPAMKDVARLLTIVINQNKHAFGVCFGLQLLAYLLNSKEGKLVKNGSWDKDVEIDILKDDLLFKNVGSKGDSFITKQYHNYSVPFLKREKLGQGTILAKSKDGIEIIRIGHVVATQFHPESRYASREAKYIYENYLRGFVLR